MMEQQRKAAVAISDVLTALQAGNMPHAAALRDALIAPSAALDTRQRTCGGVGHR